MSRMPRVACARDRLSFAGMHVLQLGHRALEWIIPLLDELLQAIVCRAWLEWDLACVSQGTQQQYPAIGANPSFPIAALDAWVLVCEAVTRPNLLSEVWLHPGRRLGTMHACQQPKRVGVLLDCDAKPVLTHSNVDLMQTNGTTRLHRAGCYRFQSGS